MLPTEKSKINLNWKDCKFGMLGASGIGKSEFWAQDDKALFIEAEAGLNFLEVYKVAVRSWDEIRGIYGALKAIVDSGQAFPYSTIVLDTIDRVKDYAEEEIIGRAKAFYKKMEINTIADIPNGAGWFRSKELINALLNKLAELPCAVAYISHLSTKRVKEIGNEYDKQTISIGGQMGEGLLAWTDHTLHVEAVLRGDRLIRTVWSIPTQSREAKSRGGIVPNGWRWTDDMKENFSKLRGLFK